MVTSQQNRRWCWWACFGFYYYSVQQEMMSSKKASQHLQQRSPQGGREGRAEKAKVRERRIATRRPCALLENSKHQATG